VDVGCGSGGKSSVASGGDEQSVVFWSSEGGDLCCSGEVGCRKSLTKYKPHI